MGAHDHPGFALAYRALAFIAERGRLADVRAEALAGAHGTLLIVGLGPGHDLQHLPRAVDHVIAIEPSEPMRRAAAPRIDRARHSGIAIDLIRALGEDLPLRSECADSALLSFVMCSVSDPGAVLGEVRRVVRPGGAICVLEHVRAPDGSALGLIQRAVGPVWPRIAGGCHADRDTVGAMRRAGLDTSGVRRSSLPDIPPVAPTVVGTAWNRPSPGRRSARPPEPDAGPYTV